MPSVAGVLLFGALWIVAGISFWGGFVASRLRFRTRAQSTPRTWSRSELDPARLRRLGPGGVVILDLSVARELRRSLAERRN